jgi:hypothetical protein
VATVASYRQAVRSVTGNGEEGEPVVTSCNWRSRKIVAPEGEHSKVLYIFSQRGEQQLELNGKTMITTFSTNASRFEFVSIEEALLAQHENDSGDELVGRFLGCEEELLEAVTRLGAPFDADNLRKVSLVAVPFVIFYFAYWKDEDPIVGVPVSLFSGQVAPRLLQYVRQFPLNATGLRVVVEPNFDLKRAFRAAAVWIESSLANDETGRTSLIWCDVTLVHQQHKQTYQSGQGKPSWEIVQMEQIEHQVVGLQPVEYLNAAIILVPHLILMLEQPVQGCGYGILDPVQGNVYLTQREISVD